MLERRTGNLPLRSAWLAETTSQPRTADQFSRAEGSQSKRTIRDSKVRPARTLGFPEPERQARAGTLPTTEHQTE